MRDLLVPIVSASPSASRWEMRKGCDKAAIDAADIGVVDDVGGGIWDRMFDVVHELTSEQDLCATAWQGRRYYYA